MYKWYTFGFYMWA